MEGRRDRTRLSACALLGTLLTVVGTVEAGKIPLQPEELQDQSDLIVVGKVLSHFEATKENRDGSQTTHVYLKVEVLEVDKGTGPAQGDTIELACWVITKAPRKGSVWDSGHAGIPADEGRARFYLKPHGSRYWDVIYPNGIERLDDGPTLNYPMQPAEPAPSLSLAIGAGTAVFLVATVAFVWLFVSRKPAPKTPGS